MVHIRWQQVADPEAYVRAVLRNEAPDIPASKLAGRWRQTEIADTALEVDQRMIAEHDANPVHQSRRDTFVALILDGGPIPPLIALGTRHYLVDGYARLRAARRLGVPTVEAIVQDTNPASTTVAAHHTPSS